MALQDLLKDFDALNQDQVAAVQAQANPLLVFTTGSLNLAFVESNSALVLWLQAIITNLLAITRASTSEENDLDTWMADFGFSRLPATTSTGVVTFSRFTPTQQAVIPIGALVSTVNAQQVFTVILDTTNPNYNANYGGYVLLPGTYSIDVPVQATVAGSVGNVAASTIIIISQPIIGVDTVNNALAFVNGADAELDDDYRARFIDYINSLSKATLLAVESAIESVQENLKYDVVENESFIGNEDLGFFYSVIDDGTGSPSTELINSVRNAIDAVRPLTSIFDVYPPIVITANISAVIALSDGYDSGDVISSVQTSLTSYINGLNIGQALPYTRLAEVIYDASDGIVNVTGMLLNGSTTDLVASAQQVIRVGTLTITT